MSDQLSRRDAIRILGAAGAAAALPAVNPGRTLAGATAVPEGVPAEILSLSSTSGVFTPPRGRSYDTFSFDFPEPSVEFDGFRFGFIVFTAENAYGLDATKMNATTTGDLMTITANGFTWAGGQEKAAGRLTATFRKTGDTIEWNALVEMPSPIKTVSTIIRGIPRGRVGFGGPGSDPSNDNEILVGYPFSGGDLFGGNSAREAWRWYTWRATSSLMRQRRRGASLRHADYLPLQSRPRRLSLGDVQTGSPGQALR